MSDNQQSVFESTCRALDRIGKRFSLDESEPSKIADAVDTYMTGWQTRHVTTLQFLEAELEDIEHGIEMAGDTETPFHKEMPRLQAQKELLDRLINKHKRRLNVGSNHTSGLPG